MQRADLITEKLLAWWDHDHADLAWRGVDDPYAVWVAEVMLQQTQITTVIPYYERWMVSFPTVEALAAASLDDVLKLWEGLGYYRRARYLHAAAQMVVDEFGGELPQTVGELMRLKGIGRYTAGAIASIAFDQSAPVLDGNVTRVLTRLFDVEADVTEAATKKRLWQLAEELVPERRPGDFNQALMELGQRICLPGDPRCLLCPLAADCKARHRGTQLERPVRPPRKATPHHQVVAGIIWHREDEPLRPDSRFLIAQRPFDGLLGGLWEFPGGKQEKGESLQAALAREIEEELGMAIEIGRFLTEVNHAYTHFRITLHAFHAIHRNGRPQHREVNDHAWVTMGDLNDYAFAVTDRKIIQQLEQEVTNLEL